MAWTESQLDAINTKGKTVLVSASAGSGKTASLTERIIRTLKLSTDPSQEYKYKTDISRLLIVTFTTAAASELRSKISAELGKALSEDPENSLLREELIKLPNAHISTMDAFFMEIVKQNFSKLGIPSSFRIGDATELKVLYSDVMEDVIDDFYNKTESDGEDIDFAALADNFTNFKGEYSLCQTLLDIHEIFDPYADGIELLRHFSNEYQSAGNKIFSTAAGKAIIRKYSRMFSDFANMCEYAEDELSRLGNFSEKYIALFRNEGKIYAAMRDAINSEDCDRILSTIGTMKYPSLPNAGKDADAKTAARFSALRTDMKLRAREAAKKLTIFPEDNGYFMKKTADICLSLYQLFREYEARLMNEKISRRVFDFSDITRFMFKLVVREDGTPTDTAKTLSEKFDEIYIDEYQDTNGIQDAIFCAIAKENNRFMVGDIKQSIYAFRGGDPGIFADYKKRFPSLDKAKESSNASVTMAENFRCDENIIKFVNAVFSFAFELCGDNIGYTDKDNLIFGKSKPYDNYESPKTVLAILNSKPEESDFTEESDTDFELQDEDSEDLKGEEREFQYIAAEINRLIKYEKKASGEPIAPGDCTILVRYVREIPLASEALKRYSIESVCQVQEELFKTPSVLLMTAILTVIDNPTDDVELTATLRSPSFGFNFDELILLRKSGDQSESLYENLISFMSGESGNEELKLKCRAFYDWLEKYRLIAKSLPVDKLLRILYRDARCAFSAASPSLSTFYEYARSYESGSFKGVYNFVRYIDSIKKRGFKSDSEFTSDINAVTVMTIHKSKGLQFPVCFVAGLSNRFSNKDLRKPFIFDREVGPAVNIVDTIGLAKYSTPLKCGVTIKKTESLCDEELRVLYVALTRAQERLYLTANAEKIDALIDKYEFMCNYSDFVADRFVSSYFTTVMRSIAEYLNRKNIGLRAFIDGNFANDPDIPFRIVLPDSDKSEISPNNELCDDSISQNNEISEKGEMTAYETQLSETLKSRFLFKYPHSHTVNIPAKLSVSKLNPAVLDGIDDCASPVGFGKRQEITLNTDFGKEMIKQVSATERGTATHLFLQFCDFEKLAENGASDELSRLIEERYIPRSTADIVRKGEIEKFRESSLFKRIKSAKKIYREQRFNLNFDAHSFTENHELASILRDSGEKLLVQGVIDIFFIDESGKLILCDYKTDRIPADIAADIEGLRNLMKLRHGEQLSYYRLAIKELMGRYPDEVIVYCTQLGKSVMIF